MIGHALGPYQVLSKLGAGGMGEVYRARDTTLDRDVALKILPASVANDPDRLMRFEREAKTLAALNHPNIAQIYGVIEEPSAGAHVHALVMELVEGEDLSAHIARGPIAWADALPIARQIAEALEAAHEQGIVHRDLKPANIKVRADGTVKVLDFGLAKALAPEGTGATADAMNSPTMTSPALTGVGLILGTAAYMAPEQAKGRPVDKRADIWAFGVVFYEMLTGRRAFTGADVTEVIAAVIRDTPDFGVLQATTPPSIRRLVARCLERDPRRRQRDMGDVVLDLTAGEAGGDEPVRRESARRPRPLAMAAVLTAVLALGLAGGWLLRPGPGTAPAASARFTVTAPGSGVASMPVLTPDGRTLVFSMNGRLYRRSLNHFDTVAIPGTEGAQVPIVSPDGRAVAFFSQGELKRVSLDGGSPVTLAEANANMPGACWCTNGEILFSRAWAAGLSSVPAGGGTPRQITEPDRSKGERAHWRPQRLPDGKRVLFTIMMAGTGVNDARIALLDVATGRYAALFPGTDGHYLSSGHILYFFGGAWRLVPFDAVAGRTTGDPVTVLADAYGVRPDGGEPGNLLSVSDTGVLAYLPGPTAPLLELVWVDRSGAIEPSGLPPRAISSADLSPDGRRVAMDRVEGGNFEVWVADLARRTEDRMNIRGGNQWPLWDPTGEWLAVISERKGQYDTYIARPDGAGERALLESDHDEAPIAWLRDRRRIIVREWRTDGSVPLLFVDPSGGGSPEVVMPHTPTQFKADLSPDDRWLAYGSDTSGRREIYVRGLARDAAALRVSSDGGDVPRWSADGRELVFVNGDTLTAVTFSVDGAVPRIGAPRALFTLPPSARLFDVGADGRFLVGRLMEPPAAPGVRVVLNWPGESGSQPPENE